MMRNDVQEQYTDILQQKIDFAISHRDLTPIRLCEDMYTSEEDLERIHDCKEAVHLKTREAIKRSDSILEELDYWEGQCHSDPEAGKNVIAFPLPRS